MYSLPLRLIFQVFKFLHFKSLTILFFYTLYYTKIAMLSKKVKSFCIRTKENWLAGIFYIMHYVHCTCSVGSRYTKYTTHNTLYYFCAQLLYMFNIVVTHRIYSDFETCKNTI